MKKNRKLDFLRRYLPVLCFELLVFGGVFSILNFYSKLTHTYPYSHISKQRRNLLFPTIFLLISTVQWWKKLLHYILLLLLLG